MSRDRRLQLRALDQLSVDDVAGYNAALAQARKGFAEAGVPVGSSLMRGSELVAAGHNRRVQNGDPIAHGEMDCLHRAGRQRTYRDTTIYTTLAPCMMCTGTIIQFKIPRVVVGEASTFEGFLEVLLDHGIQVVLIDDADAKKLMSEFIATYPDVWAEDIAD